MSTSSLSNSKGAAAVTQRPNISASRSSVAVNGKPKSLESVYPTDRQVKFLHLEAEVETLLIQLQAIQQGRAVSNLQEKIGPETAYERN